MIVVVAFKSATIHSTGISRESYIGAQKSESKRNSSVDIIDWAVSLSSPDEPTTEELLLSEVMLTSSGLLPDRLELLSTMIGSIGTEEVPVVALMVVFSKAR